MGFTVKTEAETEVRDVTEAVTERVGERGGAGLCTVFVPHTTAGVVVNEPEPGLLCDLAATLGRLVSDDREFAHDEIDDNAAAHLRAVVLGASATIPFVDGELSLGAWQAVLFVECDGPRSRRVEVATVQRN